MQFEFAWPWMFSAVLLPLVSWYFLPRAAEQNPSALFFPHGNVLNGLRGPASFNRKKLLQLLAVVSWLLLVTAAARPQWIGESIQLPVAGRSLMLAVDISGSMTTEDMLINNQAVPRLVAVKAVASDFISKREGDYLGLILFGRNAYLQSPLSYDRNTLRILLNEAVVGLAGKETAIGDAIGLAVKRLRKQPAENRVLVLLTDGANTAGHVDPIKAAELAASESIRIYTIGVGGDGVRIRGLFGLQVGGSDLDERSLQIIADTTGGRYFRARNLHELEQIYRLLDEIEPVSDDTQTFRPVKELYQWPLATAILLSLLILLTRKLS